MTGTRGPLQRLSRSPPDACCPCAIRPACRPAAGVKDIFDVAGYRTGCGNPRKFAGSHARFEHSAGRPDAARCGRAIRRQDADRRAGLLADGPERAFSLSGEPGRARSRHRRLVLRFGCGGRRRARRHRHRLRHRRLDPRAGKFLRADRAAHHARPHFARRRHAAGPFLRHVRLVRRGHRRPTRASARCCSAGSAPPGIEPRPDPGLRWTRLVARSSGGRRISSHARECVFARWRAPRAAGPLSHSTDDLYWCFRRLQGYEAWQRHGAWIIQSEPRRWALASRSASSIGATVDADGGRPRTERRDAFRARTCRSAWRRRLPCAADSSGRRPAQGCVVRRFAGLSRAGAAGCCVFPASPAFRRSRCRSARSTAHPSACRCWDRRNSDSAVDGLGRTHPCGPPKRRMTWTR